MRPFKKSLSLALIAAFLGQQSRAATFTVTDTSDAGAGTLRQAVIDSNAAGGTNNVAWGAGSGGTITLATDIDPINANTTLNVSNAPAAVSIAGTGAVPLGGAVTFNNSSVTQVWTISDVISGAGSLTKIGAGTLSLTGANTYSGGTLINGGILSINNDAALGNAAGGVSFSGGTLQTTAGITTARALTLAGSGTLDTLGFTSTLNGLISGGGALSILGAGNVFINGANTYTGGTTFNTGILTVSNSSALGTGYVTFNGGTLLSAAGLNLTNGMTLNGLGGSLDSQGGVWTLSGAIGGAGPLNLLNNGTYFLSGSNSYSGGTTLNGGILNIINGSGMGSGALTFNGGKLEANGNMTLTNAVVLNGGGGTFDTFGSTVTLSGVISGAGALTTISSGTLKLAGANTYTGGTVLNAGILNVTNDAALGAAAGTLTFDGGTLQVGGNINSTRNVILNAGGGTFDSQSFNSILSGVISGGGAFTKIGTGILTLTNANTYSGGTTIGEGTIQLGVNDALPNGNLVVNPGATFDAASFSQHLTNYSGGGTMKMVLQPTPSVIVSGNADLTGGTLSVAPPAQLIAKGQIFTPITAAGSITGTFANISAPAALSFTPDYTNPNQVSLTTVFLPLGGIAGNTPNQAAVGNALEPLRANPTGDAAVVLGNLYTLNTTQLQAALNQIGPISLAAMSGVGMAGASVESAAVGQRMSVLAQGGGSGFSSYKLAERSPYPGTLIASAGEAGAYDPRVSGGAGSPWGIFASGAATTGRLLEASAPSGVQPGYAFNSGGLTMGTDYRFTDHLAAGVSGGYLRGHASIYAPASGTVDDNSARLGFYGTAFTEGARANLYIGGARDFFSTNRGILFGGINRTASAAPRGNELNMDAGGSFDVPTSNWGTYSPFVGLAYDRLMIGSFSETGAGALDLNVSPQTSQSLRSSLGLRCSQKFAMDGWSLTPYGSLGWRHEFVNQSRPIEAQLASGAGTVFSVNTGNYARDGALLGAGAAAGLTDNVSLKFDYNGDFRSHFMDNTFTGAFRYKF